MAPSAHLIEQLTLRLQPQIPPPRILIAQKLTNRKQICQIVNQSNILHCLLSVIRQLVIRQLGVYTC